MNTWKANVRGCQPLPPQPLDAYTEGCWRVVAYTPGQFMKQLKDLYAEGRELLKAGAKIQVVNLLMQAGLEPIIRKGAWHSK